MHVRTTLVYLFVAAGATTLAQIEAPRERPTTTAPATALTGPGPCQRCRDAASAVLARPLPHRPQAVRARQRPEAHRARGPLGAGRRREPLVPRRLAQRAARQDRVRAPVRALLLQRQRALSAAASARRWTTSAPTTATAPPAPIAPTSSRTCRCPRSSARSTSRPTAWVPRRADHQGDARARARRGAEREAPGREPAVRRVLQRMSETLYPAGASVQLVDHRQHGRPRRGVARGRQGRGIATYYGPNNCVLSLAGDITAGARARRW